MRELEYRRATAETLNRMVEWDCPFNIVTASKLPPNVEGVHLTANVWGASGPETVCTYSDGPDVDLAGATEWEPVTGYSGQYGYSGPVMHPSEYLGGGMARDILDDGGTYVVTCVYDGDDSPETNEFYDLVGPEVVGWILLRYIGAAE